MICHFDIIVKESGVLEAAGCSMEEFKRGYALYCRGFCADFYRRGECKDLLMDFIKLVFQWGSLEIEILEKEVRETEQFLKELEIKKSAGTYDEWLENARRENELFAPLLKAIFKKIGQKPMKKSNNLN